MVVTANKTNTDFRIEYSLNSIFKQNYSNYFVVIAANKAEDSSDELYRKYLHFYNISPNKYVYIENTEDQSRMSNIYTAAHQYCARDSIVITLDSID